jgi:two-component system response regulator HydG
LSERAADIPLLIEHFIQLHSARHHKKIKSMTTAARRRLMAFNRPGNVRQLKNAIESMVVVDFDEVLDVDDLPPELLTPGEQPEPVGASAGLGDLVGRPMSEIEGLFIAETLKSTAGNREEAAEMLGIGERTLYRKIKEFGLN